MKDFSYGIIPVRKKGKKGAWEVLLIQHHHGHWSFPKGHAEAEEEPLQAAARELKEETGLSISKLLSEDPLIEKYQFTQKGELVFKTVYYFIASVMGQVVLQESELKAYQWVLLEEAYKHVTFPESQRLSMAAFNLLDGRMDIDGR